MPYAYLCAQSLQSCLTLCNPMDYSPPGSSVHGILQEEYWSELRFPPPWDLTDPRIEAEPLKSPTLAGGFFTSEPSWKPFTFYIIF